MEVKTNSLKGNKIKTIIRTIIVLDDRKSWKYAFKILRENDFPPKTLCIVKIILQMRGQKQEIFADV